MRVVVQRVSSARVSVDGDEVASIGPGLLLLVGVARGDNNEDAAAVAAKIAGLRMFADDRGRMNRSVVDVGGAVLVVSQFTLVADLAHGRRPSFTSAAEAGLADTLVTAVAEGLTQAGLSVSSGVFGARMEVGLVNDGPVTFVVEVSGGKVIG